MVETENAEQVRMRMYKKAWAYNNPEKVRLSQQKYADKNREKIKEKRNNWVKNNPEKNRLSKKKYREKNRELLRQKHKEYDLAHKEERALYIKKYHEANKEIRKEQARIRRRNRVPQRKISDAVSCGIRNSLIKGKNGFHWETLVGYTIDDLINHLEKQFTTGMSWDNYGKWEIDHIIPISFFKYVTYIDTEFRMCWRLENLQPLWAEDNLRKSDKIREYKYG